MLNLIKAILKFSFFALTVLVVANWIEWDGKTLSEQIRSQVSRASPSDMIEQVRSWAHQLTHDAAQGSKKKSKSLSSAENKEESESIPSTERQKLRALIQELNSSK